MKLYLISANCNWYDSFDSAIVAAKSEEDAKTIHPNGSTNWDTGTWAGSPNEVSSELIGTAVRGTKRGVLLASFNAG